ncbi:hypothetical protein BCR39DRAFT_558040 [Naematelia encephala]|uniref:Box C/D snoRNA protein 1 n=1 Tax=Naematelia encephala TaxID=71784 RepID=A0A1Y2BAX3_9TREE|nr:hypothetical protein BCR39DRAFT_558040 [Naematelia encephala]
MTEIPIAGPSKPRTQLCAICSTATSKYTCPRCSLATCSLSCSKTHKERFACTGIRDPTAFRPLKDFSQGAWSDDFRWLEEGRRKIATWGEGLPKDESGGIRGGGARGRGRGGRGGGAGAMSNGRTRKSGHEILRAQLGRRGVWMQVMPDGMGRRKSNQSGYNAKNQTIHLTVQIVVPKDLLPEQEADEPKTITQHRVLFSHSDVTILPKLSSLLSPDLAEDAILLLPFHPSPARPTPDDLPDQHPRLYFPPLDTNQTLSEALRGTAFVEFPAIHLISKKAWEESVSGGRVRIVPLAEPRSGGDMGRQRDSGWGNKRKGGPVEEEAAGQNSDAKKMKAHQGLMALGEYGSDSEVSDGDEGQGQEERELLGNGEELGHKGGPTGEEADFHGDLGEAEVAVLQAVGQAMVADLDRM